MIVNMLHGKVAPVVTLRGVVCHDWRIEGLCVATVAESTMAVHLEFVSICAAAEITAARLDELGPAGRSSSNRLSMKTIQMVYARYHVMSLEMEAQPELDSVSRAEKCSGGWQVQTEDQQQSRARKTSYHFLRPLEAMPLGVLGWLLGAESLGPQHHFSTSAKHQQHNIFEWPLDLLPFNKTKLTDSKYALVEIVKFSRIQNPHGENPSSLPSQWESMRLNPGEPCSPPSPRADPRMLFWHNDELLRRR